MKHRGWMNAEELAAYARSSVVAYRYWIAATGQTCGHPGKEVVRTARPGGHTNDCVCFICGRSWTEHNIHFPPPYWQQGKAEQHAADWSAKIERIEARAWLVFYGWTLRSICRTRQQARDVMLVLKGFDK